MDVPKSPNEDDFQLLADQLREWLEQKPYVPKNVEEKLYRRFVHSCYYDLDKAKAAADLFFSIRSSSPELFTDRDPLSPHMQKVLSITNLARYRISEKRNLWLWQLDDPGLQQFDHLLEAKVFNLFADSWLLDDDFMEEGDILVHDAKHMSLKILFKYSYSIAKKILKYQQEAVPIRLNQVHVINAPSVMNRIVAVIKPFLSKELMQVIHFHTTQYSTLYEYIDRSELPEDFGGTRGKLSDHAAETIACFMKNRKYLMDDNLWRINPNN